MLRIIWMAPKILELNSWLSVGLKIIYSRPQNEKNNIGLSNGLKMVNNPKKPWFFLDFDLKMVYGLILDNELFHIRKSVPEPKYTEIIEATHLKSDKVSLRTGMISTMCLCRFGQAKFAYDGSILSSSKFLLCPGSL